MIRVTVDDALRRVILVLEGDVSGAELLRDKMAVAERGVTYDFVYDLLTYTGSLDHDDIDRLATAWTRTVRGRDMGLRTVLISRDPGFRLWAQVFPMQFPGRRFHVVGSWAEAEQALAQT